MKLFLCVGFLALKASAKNSKWIRGGEDEARGEAIADHHRQVPIENLKTILEGAPHRALQDEKDVCGEVGQACAKGAICSMNKAKKKDWCLCDEASGYFNLTKYHGNIVENELQGYFGCMSPNECKNQFNTTNVCGGEGVGCVNMETMDGRYKCICEAGYSANASSFGDYGPEVCIKEQDNSTLNVCESSDNPCGNKTCAFIPPTSYTCACPDDLIETATGECLDPSTDLDLTGCDPLRPNDSCPEEERVCDANIKKCVCKEGFIQPAGAGGQCQPINECDLNLDVMCDQRGRGTDNARSKCLDDDGRGNPVPGYSCECLDGFEDFPNSVRGTNCLKTPEPATDAPITAAPITSAPTAPPVPGPCTGVFCNVVGSSCIAALGRCACLAPAYIQSVGPGFGCDETCAANTECGENFECSGQRCVACPDTKTRDAVSVGGCVDLTLTSEVLPILDNAVVTSTLTTDIDCVILNLAVQLDITHTFIGDLDISMKHDDTGTNIVLFGDGGANSFGFPCGATANMTDVRFDDAASDAIPQSCASPFTGVFKPTIFTSSNSFTTPLLSIFDGESSKGSWTISVADENFLCEGLLNYWTLAFDLDCDE